MRLSRTDRLDLLHGTVIERPSNISWASDAKRPKRAAREMWEMVRVINQDLLGRAEYLRSSEAMVNCTTCHRGQIKPVLDM